MITLHYAYLYFCEAYTHTYHPLWHFRHVMTFLFHRNCCRCKVWCDVFIIVMILPPSMNKNDKEWGEETLKVFYSNLDVCMYMGISAGKNEHCSMAEHDKDEILFLIWRWLSKQLNIFIIFMNMSFSIPIFDHHYHPPSSSSFAAAIRQNRRNN